MNKEVTCILTSCGRFDLLRITLESFFKFNTYDIKEFIVYEDSGQKIPSDIKDSYPFIKYIDFVGKHGQIHALDTLWAMVKTPYAFTMEDDWETTRPGFIEASMEIMEQNPKVLMVWLKELGVNNVHPVEWHRNGYFNKDELKQFNGQPYGIFKTSPNLWAWHRFNPSLKRKSDYDLIAPFSKHTEWNPSKPWKSEADISKVYHKLGFTAAILPAGYMRHIGQNQHVGP